MPSEVLTREWRHVDFNRGIVRLDVGETKNGKGRIFPLTPELLNVLQEQKRRTEKLQREQNRIIPLVFHHNGHSMVDSHRKPTRYFRNAWKMACEKAKIAGAIPHDFRRSAVRRFEQNGIPRQVGMALSGHSTESVYRRYSIITEQDLFEAAKKLSSLEPSKVLAK